MNLISTLGLGAFFNPGFTDLGTVYRTTAAPTTNNAAAPNQVTIAGVQYLVTADNWNDLAQKRIAQRERETGKPLTAAEKTTILQALRNLVTATQKNAAPTVDPLSGANVATDPRTDPRSVTIDGRTYIVTRDNVAELARLRIAQLERERFTTLSDGERRTIARALANLATDAGPQDANPSVSTLQIALEGIKRTAAIAERGVQRISAALNNSDPNGGLNRTLSILELAGYVGLVWGVSKLLRG